MSVIATASKETSSEENFRTAQLVEGGTKTSNSHSTYSTGTLSHTLAFNTTQITSKANGNKPRWDDPCHCLASTDHPPAVVIKNE